MEKSTEINQNFSDAEFITWLISRLQYIHGYSIDNNIIVRLEKIMNKSTMYQPLCSDEDLDKIISKYFVDFCLTRDYSLSIGYTEEERNNLRQSIKQIITDVILRNVPEDILLK